MAPSYVVGANYRVLIYCTCHFQGGSFGFSFCLLVSSVSDFYPGTRGVVVGTFFFFLGSPVQSHCGEGGTLQTNNTGVCPQCLSHTWPAPAHGTCTLPDHTAQALGCSSGNHPRPDLGCMHLPGLSLSGSGTRVVLRGANSVGPAFCALHSSEQLGWWGVWRARSLRLIASPVPATWFPGYTTGAPSQADDCPEPQEVLVSKEACLQFGRLCLSGAAIAPFQLWLPVTRGERSAAS